MHTIESTIFHTDLYRQCRHETKTHLIHVFLICINCIDMCTIKSIKLHTALCQQCRHVLYAMSYIIFNLSALQRSLAIQIGRIMNHILPGGLRGTAL